MKNLGKVPSDINDWEKFRRVVFANVAAACGSPQMGTDMLMAAEDHKGEVEDLEVEEPWEKVMALLAVQLPNAMTDQDMIREATALQDRYLKLHRRQLPGLCHWVIISRRFKKDNKLALHYAIRDLQCCKYQGNGGLASLKTFVGKFGNVLTNLSDAGAKIDNSNAKQRARCNVSLVIQLCGIDLHSDVHRTLVCAKSLHQILGLRCGEV